MTTKNEVYDAYLEALVDYLGDVDAVECDIKFKDEEESNTTIVKLGTSLDKNDGTIFFYTKDIDEFLSLMDEDNGEGFVVTRVHRLFNLEIHNKPNNMETKVCVKCGKELPMDSFYKNTKTKDGVDSYCKECKKACNKLYSEKRKAEKKRIEEEREEYDKKYRVYTNRELAKFTPRDLMLELKARGYEGELLFREVKVTERRINLGKLE